LPPPLLLLLLLLLLLPARRGCEQRVTFFIRRKTDTLTKQQVRRWRALARQFRF
jgi:hypothetical protein